MCVAEMSARLIVSPREGFTRMKGVPDVAGDSA